jgi:hypothetical protein
MAMPGAAEIKRATVFIADPTPALSFDTAPVTASVSGALSQVSAHAGTPARSNAGSG